VKRKVDYLGSEGFDRRKGHRLPKGLTVHR